MDAGDTIVACGTPWGRAAISVVRLSGPQAQAIAQELCGDGPPWVARRASLRTVRDADGGVLDEVLALWMPAPRSYTGEDVVELSGHGNPVLVTAVLDACVAAGARPARAGEFTRQALENGRTDLLRAEALAGLIAARSIAGARLARTGLDGENTELVGSMRETLLDLVAEIEARLDHPDDDLSTRDDATVTEALEALAARAEAVAGTWSASRVALHGATVAIIGPVNAGKSSLFNHLVGTERALVSDRPGTTRDVVERAVAVDGIEVNFLDTAGEGGTNDALERAGVALGRTLTADVDLHLVVLPMDRPVDSVATEVLDRTAQMPRILVGTFADKAPDPAGPAVDHAIDNIAGTGITELRRTIREVVGNESPTAQRVVALSQRQHDLFRAVARHAREAGVALNGDVGPAVAAEALICALERLGNLAGVDVREAVLDRLFARFCIGK